jgi:hypothetical protein
MPSKLVTLKGSPRCYKKLSCANEFVSVSSLFITTMACFKGANNPCLRSTIQPDVGRCFEIVAELFRIGDAVNISRAIAKLGLILRERVLGTR